MKRVFVFTGLKVAELSAIVFGPYFLGMLVSKWSWLYSTMKFDGETYWFIGSICIAYLFVILIVIALIATICIKNWEWATKISE